MNADDMKRTQRLRRTDPREVGGYTLLGRLGAGGMGVVYLARAADRSLVAVKIVHAELAGDDEFRGRFRSEVERARQVPPFCTAEVLDADAGHNPPYLVVEYVDGPSLGEAVEDRGPLSVANVHAVAVGVASALSAIHGAGVIHRDLKPRNVLLAPGSPKVIDFGIARAFEATSQHTRTGQLVGTVAYMAPERFSAEPGTPLTPAADIFAWGSVVAYAATGRAPFDGDSPPVTAARILSGVPNLNGLTDPLLRLVELALAKDPEHRPTARELLDLLLTAGTHAPATSTHAGTRATARASAAPTVGIDRRSGSRAPVTTRATTIPRQRGPQPDRRPRPDGFPTPPGTGGPGHHVPWVPAVDAGRQSRPPQPPPPPRGRAAHSRRSSGSVAVQVSALLLLVTALVVGGVATVVDRRTGRADATYAASAAPGRPDRSIMRSEMTGTCLDVEGGRSADGQPVQMWPCTRGANQVWRWETDGTLRSLGRCLAVVDDATADGAAVRLGDCDGSPGQQWRYTEGRDVVNPPADKCLDIRDRSTADGARVQLWSCAGAANQKWALPG
jgi:serine/threonine protein kinase